MAEIPARTSGLIGLKKAPGRARTIAVYPYPAPNDANDNPYLALFYQALKKHGYMTTEFWPPGPKGISRLAANVGFIHFHWPETIWRTYPGRYLYGLEQRARLPLPDSLRRHFGLESFLKAIDAAKHAGKRVVWTVHNLEPHEGMSREDVRGFDKLYKSSDLLVCHDRAAQLAVAGKANASSLIVCMPHGNYDGVYPVPRAEAIIRDEYGLGSSRILLMIGQMRKYKGFDVAIQAMRHIPRDLTLVMAGRFRDSATSDFAMNIVGAGQCVLMLDRFLPVQGISDLASISEMILLPYRKVTGSGVLELAFTLSRGVVASNLPYFQESLRGSPNAGRLFEVGNPKDLARAVLEYLEVPQESRAAASRRLAERRSWNNVIGPVVEAFDCLSVRAV